MPAVNKCLISGVVGQRAMFARKPRRIEAAPRTVSFGQRTRSHRQLPPEQDEKGMTEDERAGWHHGLDGHEFE